MMPLWTTAISPFDACGCAFAGDGAPCVAQRVCEMPVTARRDASHSACAARSATRAVLTSRASCGAPAAAVDDREAGRIVAAIFETADAVDQHRNNIARSRPRRRYRTCASVSRPLRVLGFFIGRFQPGTLTCGARATVSAPAGASFADRAARRRSSRRGRSVTGATSTQFEPIDASSSITVRCLFAPS